MSKRIVILGAGGLIGHKLFEKLSDRFGEVYGTLHGSRDKFAGVPLLESDRIIEHVDVHDFDKLTGIIHATGANVILNCVGITKRRSEVNEPLQAIGVNARFPHQLATWAGGEGRRVIHFSTDCVFDGSEGDYTEESITTARDAYGQTKALGEIRYDHSLTIRSSFIGRELSVFSELLEWFLAQEGNTIKGFTNALYTGVSTIVMSQVVGDIIEHQPQLGGLHQLSVQQPISKYDLLCLARDAFGVNVEIVPDGDFEIKPTLCSAKLRAAMPIETPSWQQMMEELAAETIYEPLKAQAKAAA